MAEKAPSRLRGMISRIQPKAVWAVVKDHLLDVALFGVASVAGVAFFLGAGLFEREGGLAGTIATLSTGSASKRVRDDRMFRPVGDGTPFQNLDAIFVAENATATMSTPDGFELELSPRTLLVFRAPFKTRGDVRTRYRLIIGKVTIKTPTGSTTQVASSNQFDELPTDSAKQITHIDGMDVKVHPPHGATIFIPEGPESGHEVPFTWGRPMTGYLVIAEANGASASYIKIENESYKRATPAGDHPYLWQITDPQKRPILGPFRFELRTAAKGDWEKIMRDPAAQKPKGKIDVIFDSHSRSN